MRIDRAADFAAYARARRPSLLRYGFALTGSRIDLHISSWRSRRREVLHAGPWFAAVRSR